MSNTHRVCDVFVTIPVLGTVSRDESGAIVKHGGKCRVQVYAVKDGQALTDGLLVGSTVFSGYTESPYRRKIKVIVPDGHSLMALHMGEDDKPLSWDSLPLAIAGEVPIGTLSEPAQLADCFNVINGMVFIADEFILSSAKIESADVKDDSVGQVLDEALSLIDTSHLNKLGSPSIGEVTINVGIKDGADDGVLNQLETLILDCIKRSLKPGGLLHKARR